MYVCCCIGVTDREIHAEIESGACSVEAIAACTGAGTRCGTCRQEIASMLDRRLGESGVSHGRGADGHVHLGVVDVAAE